MLNFGFLYIFKWILRLREASCHPHNGVSGECRQAEDSKSGWRFFLEAREIKKIGLQNASNFYFKRNLWMVPKKIPTFFRKISKDILKILLTMHVSSKLNDPIKSY